MTPWGWILYDPKHVGVKWILCDFNVFLINMCISWLLLIKLLSIHGSTMKLKNKQICVLIRRRFYIRLNKIISFKLNYIYCWEDYDREIHVTTYGEPRGRNFCERNELEDGYGLKLQPVHEHTKVMRILSGLRMNMQEIVWRCKLGRLISFVILGKQYAWSSSEAAVYKGSCD